MDLSDVNDGLEEMALPAETKKAVLQLIDIKINNDMKEVISKLEHVESKLSNEMRLINDKLSNEIKLVDGKLGNENKVIYWVVGIAMAIIVLLVAAKN
jgi:hypothetical protein